MAKSYVVGFEAVELVDGLSEDKPVWLYMRATLYNEGDFANPLWFGEVGSLPPDANRPPTGYPVGDAGWYADHLIVGKEVSNSSPTNLPNFSVGPVTVDDGQVLEVLIFMLPKVWFETKSVSPEDADRIGFGLLGAGIGAGGFGIVGAVVGAVFGGLSPQDHDVTVPCYNTVISARQVFTPADLDSMQSLGRQRFGPQDNESHEACHQPIDSYYWLSANNAGWRFGTTTPDTKKEICVLEPRAYEPAADQVRGGWGDAGDRVNDCILVSVLCTDSGHGDVTISRGPGGAYATIAQFTRVPIIRLTPEPAFTRNVFDDGCPSRSVHPDCPQCLSFANLSTELMITPQLMHLGMQPGSHMGTRPPFPFAIDTDRVTLPRPRDCGPCAKRAMSTQRPAAARVADANAERIRQARAEVRDRLEPGRLGERWNVAFADTGMVKLWPNGAEQTRDLKAIGISEDVVAWFPLLPESGISWVLPCSEEFRLATYQEIRGKTGCIGRLRYTRRNAQGYIVADVMLSRLPSRLN